MAFGDQHWNLPGDTVIWALSELDRVVGPEALASSPGPRNWPEWDYLYSLPRRTRRRLIGAGYMRRGGMQPDLLADVIVPRVAEVETIDDAMEWYVKTCLTAITERRLLAHRRRHLAVARRNGHQTYYQHRTEYARSLGYDSLYDMRRKKKWT